MKYVLGEWVYLVMCGASIVLVDPVFAGAGIESLDFDSRVSLLSRSNPIGIQLQGTLGVSRSLWSAEQDDPKKQWQYGYVRAGLNYATSAVINRLGFEIQIFPVSILGFSAGYDFGFRSFKPPFADCVAFQCVGRVDRRFFRVQSVLGYQKFFMTYQGKIENLWAPGKRDLFFDEVTLLVGDPSGQTDVVTHQLAIVRKISDRWMTGLTALYSTRLKTPDESLLWGPVASVNSFLGNPNLSFMFGVGPIRSTYIRWGSTAFAVLSLSLNPGMSIQDQSLQKKD